MNLQTQDVEEYRQAAEVLYVLDAAKTYSDGVVSKVALQKVVYLSVVLGPIKDMVMNFLRFQYNVRGPFNPDVQNSIDHLVGVGFARIVDYNYINEKRILVSYCITEKGQHSVEVLSKRRLEEEKRWWISSVCRLAINYSRENFKSTWSGLDKIVDLVYQDPTFLKGRREETFRTAIDLGNKTDLTTELIAQTKQYIETSDIKIVDADERRLSEIILVTFFEYLFSRISTQAV